MAEKLSHDDLVEQVKAPGWQLVTDKDDQPVTGSLEDVLKASHDRRGSGQPPGLIRQIETTIELDMLQIEQLWRYLGLPV